MIFFLFLATFSLPGQFTKGKAKFPCYGSEISCLKLVSKRFNISYHAAKESFVIGRIENFEQTVYESEYAFITRKIPNLKLDLCRIPYNRPSIRLVSTVALDLDLISSSKDCTSADLNLEFTNISLHLDLPGIESIKIKKFTVVDGKIFSKNKLLIIAKEANSPVYDPEIITLVSEEQAYDNKYSLVVKNKEKSKDNRINKLFEEYYECDYGQSCSNAVIANEPKVHINLLNNAQDEVNLDGLTLLKYVKFTSDKTKTYNIKLPPNSFEEFIIENLNANFVGNINTKIFKSNSSYPQISQIIADNVVIDSTKGFRIINVTKNIYLSEQVSKITISTYLDDPANPFKSYINLLTNDPNSLSINIHLNDDAAADIIASSDSAINVALSEPNFMASVNLYLNATNIKYNSKEEAKNVSIFVNSVNETQFDIESSKDGTLYTKFIFKSLTKFFIDRDMTFQNATLINANVTLCIKGSSSKSIKFVDIEFQSDAFLFLESRFTISIDKIKLSSTSFIPFAFGVSSTNVSVVNLKSGILTDQLPNKVLFWVSDAENLMNGAADLCQNNFTILTYDNFDFANNKIFLFWEEITPQIHGFHTSDSVLLVGYNISKVWTYSPYDSANDLPLELCFSDNKIPQCSENAYYAKEEYYSAINKLIPNGIKNLTFIIDKPVELGGEINAIEGMSLTIKGTDKYPVKFTDLNIKIKNDQPASKKPSLTLDNILLDGSWSFVKYNITISNLMYDQQAKIQFTDSDIYSDYQSAVYSKLKPTGNKAESLNVRFMPISSDIYNLEGEYPRLDQGYLYPSKNYKLEYPYANTVNQFHSPSPIYNTQYNMEMTFHYNTSIIFDGPLPIPPATNINIKLDNSAYVTLLYSDGLYPFNFDKTDNVNLIPFPTSGSIQGQPNQDGYVFVDTISLNQDGTVEATDKNNNSSPLLVNHLIIGNNADITADSMTIGNSIYMKGASTLTTGQKYILIKSDSVVITFDNAGINIPLIDLSSNEMQIQSPILFNVNMNFNENSDSDILSKFKNGFPIVRGTYFNCGEWSNRILIKTNTNLQFNTACSGNELLLTAKQLEKQLNGPSSLLQQVGWLPIVIAALFLLILIALIFLIARCCCCNCTICGPRKRKWGKESSSSDSYRRGYKDQI